MSAGVVGMLLGLIAATGLILVLTYAPPLRSVRLVDRLAPYVHDTPPPSRLLGTATEPGLLTAVRRVFGPVLGDGARLVDRVLGGRSAVRRRLDALSTRRASRTSGSSRSSGAASDWSAPGCWHRSARCWPGASTCCPWRCCAWADWSAACSAGTGG